MNHIATAMTPIAVGASHLRRGATGGVIVIVIAVSQRGGIVL
jgi:hypothetical protein